MKAHKRKQLIYKRIRLMRSIVNKFKKIKIWKEDKIKRKKSKIFKIEVYQFKLTKRKEIQRNNKI